MLIDFLYQLKESIDRHGIRWGVVLTIIVMYRKELRNMRLDKRDEAIFNNQRIIMEKLGVVDQWNGQPKLSDADLLNLKRLQQLYWEAISPAVNLYKRRVGKMQLNKAWLSALVVYIIGQLSLKYGFTWNDAWSDMITDMIITFVIPLIVAFMNRTKEAKDEKRPIDTGSAV